MSMYAVQHTQVEGELATFERRSAIEVECPQPGPKGQTFLEVHGVCRAERPLSEFSRLGV